MSGGGIRGWAMVVIGLAGAATAGPRSPRNLPTRPRGPLKWNRMLRLIRRPR